jgi:alkaline phosphatase
MMVPDGCGDTHTTLARWYKGSSLALDEMPSGLVRTYASNSIITDSAPAATAFATGHKTADKFVGVLPGPVTIPGVEPVPAELQYSPVASLVEAAKAKGMSVGLIATSNVQHATPAAFSSHVHARSYYNEIAEQQVYMDIDVMFGGGLQYLLPDDMGGVRTDGEDLVSVLESRGYEFVMDRDGMMSLPAQTDKVWGMFAMEAMAKDYDRSLPQFSSQPSLSEMTDKAIEVLSQNPRGFFLMVEGSQVDWSSHANDPIGVISEVLAFDAAVESALDFAKMDRHTLVLAFTDHGNGGMSIGSTKTDNSYSSLPLSAMLDPLMQADLTAEGLTYVIPMNADSATVRQIVSERFGISDLTDEEVAQIQSARNAGKSLEGLCGKMISQRSTIGWTTGGHCGEDVTLYSFGPNRPVGLFENTDLAKICADALHLNLGVTTTDLFVDADAACEARGADTFLDLSDPVNGVLLVQVDGVTVASMPLSKDLMYFDGDVYELSGIVVYAPKTGKVYVPQEALDILALA